MRNESLISVPSAPFQVFSFPLAEQFVDLDSYAAEMSGTIYLSFINNFDLQ
jgi:hypothetical protein